MIGADIRELRLLADLDAIASGYEQRFSARPINLSLWNPSPSFAKGLELQLPSSKDLKGIDYVFSYDLSEREPMLKALGFNPKTFGCLLTHSGSTAIISAANWLKRMGSSKILIIGPRYFTVPHALTSLGVSWGVLHMHRLAGGRFSFPSLDESLFNEIDGIWLTNPIYCTGVRYKLEEVRRFVSNALSRGIRVVVDECLATADSRLGPQFSDKGIATIHAPHKAICVNGIKFAAVVFDSSEQDHFDSWTDVWNGCLPLSSIVGLRHFLSPDFERYQSRFHRAITANHEKVRKVVGATDTIVLDGDTEGYLISVYAPKINAGAGVSFSFLEEATLASGATFISGARNEMDPTAGLSFRLNLAAIDASAIGAFGRLCDWLYLKSIH